MNPDGGSNTRMQVSNSAVIRFNGRCDKNKRKAITVKNKNSRDRSNDYINYRIFIWLTETVGERQPERDKTRATGKTRATKWESNYKRIDIGESKDTRYGKIYKRDIR